MASPDGKGAASGLDWKKSAVDDGIHEEVAKKVEMKRLAKEEANRIKEAIAQSRKAAMSPEAAQEEEEKQPANDHTTDPIKP